MVAQRPMQSVTAHAVFHIVYFLYNLQAECAMQTS